MQDLWRAVQEMELVLTTLPTHTSQAKKENISLCHLQRTTYSLAQSEAYGRNAWLDSPNLRRVWQKIRLPTRIGNTPKDLPYGRKKLQMRPV